MLIGVEVTSREWVERIRLGTFATEARALEIARELGVDPPVERLTEADLLAERERFLEFATDFFRESKCDPDSEVASSQLEVWTKTQKVYPELEDRIRCAQEDD